MSFLAVGIAVQCVIGTTEHGRVRFTSDTVATLFIFDESVGTIPFGCSISHCFGSWYIKFSGHLEISPSHSRSASSKYLTLRAFQGVVTSGYLSRRKRQSLPENKEKS